MIFDLYAVISNFAVNLTHKLKGPFFRWISLFLCLLRLNLLSSDESESFDEESEESCFVCFWRFFIWSHPFLLDLLYLLSLDESYSLNDKSDNDGSDYGSSGTCAFTFRFGNSVVHVSSMGSSFSSSNRSLVQFWRCYICRVCTNRNWFQRWLTDQNILALKFLIFSPYFKISFIAIFLVCTCRTRSERCCFTKHSLAPTNGIHPSSF